MLLFLFFNDLLLQLTVPKSVRNRCVIDVFGGVFILRAVRLSNKLFGQGYVKERLKSSLRKFYGRYEDLTKQYEAPLSRMLHDILDDDHIQ